jgi:hypothetical protein
MVWVETTERPPVRLRIDSPLPLCSRYQCSGTPLEHYEGPAIEVYVFHLDEDLPETVIRRRDAPTW